MVLASQAEALTAVELHNSVLAPRPLESFLVHMHVAWLYLLHSEFERKGVDFHYREQGTQRFVRVDGDEKSWELEKCIVHRWPNSVDPVRKNLELTVKLRNKVEHRWERGLMVASFGFTQAHIINYEKELVAEFGVEYSIANRVHFPVALSTFSREGVAALVKAQEELPKPLRDFFIEFRAGLTDEVLSDKQFEFRIEIIQKRTPKSEADLAVEFVRLDDLTEEERVAYEGLEKTGRVIIREKLTPAPDDRDWLSPKEVSAGVQGKLGWRFVASAEFPKAWQHFKVRPGTNAVGEARKKTIPEYCRFDKRYESYSYTREFVDLLVRECATPEAFEIVIGWPPRPLPNTCRDDGRSLVPRSKGRLKSV